MILNIVFCKYFTHLINYLQRILLKYDIQVCVIKEIDITVLSMHLIFNLRDLIDLPQNYIVYNFEQLEISNLSDLFYINLNNAHKILDYSLNNIQFLSSRNISAIHIPYTWFPNLKTISHPIPMHERTNSFMFIGNMNKRRVDVLRPLHKYAKKHNLQMFISSNCWVEYYNSISSTSKISINLHFYDNNTILEVHRIIPNILNKIIVITERSNDSFYDDMLDNCVTWIDSVSDLEAKFNELINMKSDDLDNLANERLYTLLNKTKIFDSNIHLITNSISYTNS